MILQRTKNSMLEEGIRVWAPCPEVATWRGAEFTEGKGIEHNEMNCPVGYCSSMLASVGTELRAAELHP